MKALNFTICACGKCLDDKNQWVKYKSNEELIETRLKKTLPKNSVKTVFYEKLSIPTQLKEKLESTVIVEGKEKDSAQRIKIFFKLSRCNLCQKQGSAYFEAVMQIRSDNPDILDESVRYLQTRIHNMRDKGMFINKVERFDNGFDLYLTHKKMSQLLANELQENYGGFVKASPHLFSRDRMTSKDMYRLSILVELPRFGRGDVLVVDDKVYLVEKLGKNIKLSDLQKTNSIAMDYGKMDYTVLKKHNAYVSKVHPVLEVINPLDYQSSMVKNKTTRHLSLGQNIKVVIHKGIYIVD